MASTTTTPICMFCGCFIVGKAHKDYDYHPVIRYYCSDCAED